MALTDSLRAWWDFDSASGKDAADKTGNGYAMYEKNGSIPRVGESTTGLSTGQACDMRQSSNDAWRRDNMDIWPSSGPVSLAVTTVWNGDGTDGMRIGFYNTANYHSPFALFNNQNQSPDETRWKIEADGNRTSGSSGRVLYTTVGLKIFVVGWWDRGGTGDIKLSVRSSSESSWNTVTGTRDSTSDYAPENFGVGDIGTYSYYYDGVLDSLAFWNKTISDSERDTYYNNGNGVEYADISNSAPSASLAVSQV